MISQHQMVFHGEYEYYMYLAERVTRQHSPDFPLRAPVDPPRFIRRPELMDAETITILQAEILFDHFLREPEVAYDQYIVEHLMPRRPPVPIETMRAIAVPGGYVPPPAAQPDMLPLPSPAVSPEHDATIPDDDDNDDQHGGDNFGGFDFGGAEQLAPPHSRGTPPAVRCYDTAGPSQVLMLPAPPTHQASPSRPPGYDTPPTIAYHLPPIPLIYRYT